MKKTAIIVLVLFLFSAVSVIALTSSEARQDWLDAKEKTADANLVYKQAQLDYSKNPSPANDKKVIENAKVVLNSALDEAEAWLNWKNIEASENPAVPSDLKARIKNDVNTNLYKIADLRTAVNGITTRAQIGGVFLKTLGKYVELLTDVARDSGYMWIHTANTNADKIEAYEAKLRESAAGNEDLLAKLDIAKAELETARNKINMAEKAYDNVKLPGTPFIKFAEGNGYLRQARTNMLNSYIQLEFVYNSIVSGT